MEVNGYEIKPGAYLKGAYLKGAYLFKANLTRANLEGANLEGANLFGANLSIANLTGATRRSAIQPALSHRDRVPPVHNGKSSTGAAQFHRSDPSG